MTEPNYLDRHVGMKIVCISDEYELTITTRRWFGLRSTEQRIRHNLTCGDVYTLTSMHKKTTSVGDLIFVHVAEARHIGIEPDIPFPAKLFRPMQTRQTDISVFTDMLKDVREKVPS